MTSYRLPIEVQPLETGRYLAVCPAIQGCHAEGDTIAEAIENLQDVARQLLELRLEDGLPIPPELAQADSQTVVRGEVLVTIAV
jgi:predicted RNase H-like HicB family nuclease